MELIHELNPTGLSVSDNESRERYTMKSRLQTLLVEQFRDELVIEPDGKPGVVGMRLRNVPLDACHAVIAELGEEARSWVQFQLDTLSASVKQSGAAAATSPKPPTRTPRRASAGDGDGDLLAQARREVDAYAFDEARATLDEAVSEGVPGAALVLAELLVETLCADADALALEERLDAEELEEPQIRILLAVAAARMGRADDARRLLRGIDADPGHARAADALILLARMSIGAGAVSDAQRLLEDARQFDARHPELVAVADEIAARRRHAREPLEKELEAAWAEGRSDAERLARELLQRFPDSRVAGRVLKQIDERRREGEARALVEKASSALSAGDVDGATRAARAAHALGADTADLERSIAAARARRRAADVERVVAELGSSRTAGLASYAALDQETRAVVRARTNVAGVEWLDQLLASRDLDAPRALAAVAALESALASLADGLVDDAQRAFESHADALDVVPRARKVKTEITSRLAERRRDEVAAALQLAASALEGDDPREARRLLDSIDARGCGAELASRHAELRKEHARKTDIASASDRVQPQLDRRDFFAALRDVEFLIASDVAKQEKWREQRALIDEAISAHFRVRVHELEESDVAPPIGALAIDRGIAAEGPRIWLGEDRLFFCAAAGPYLFISVHDVGGARRQELVQVLLPAPMRDVDVLVDGKRLLIAGDSGLLVLDIDEWRVVGWSSLLALVSPGEILDDIAIAPGGRQLWVETRETAASASSSRILDVEHWTKQREVKDTHASPLHGVGEGGLMFSHLYFDNKGARLFTPRGHVASTLSFEEPTRIHALAAHPEAANNLVAALGPDRNPFADDDDEEEEGCVEVIELARATEWTRTGTPLPVDDMFEDGASSLATSRDERCTFFLYTVAAEEGEPRPAGKRLLALTRDGADAGLVKTYELAVAEHHTLLAQDAGARSALLLTMRNGELQVAKLGRSVPTLSSGPAMSRHLPQLAPPFMCDWHDAEGFERARVFEQELRREPRERRLACALEETRGKSAATVTAYVWALQLLGDSAAALELAATSASAAPEDVKIAMCHAEVAADAGEWSQVLRTLSREGLEARMPEGAEGHYLHLLGIAHLRTGGPHAYEAARETWERGGNSAKRCRLGDCLDVISAVREDIDVREWGPDRPLLQQLLGVIRVADACLARGDVRGALTATRRYAVWSGGELQSVARLAEAELQGEPTDGVGVFTKTLGLSTFVAVAQNRQHERRGDLPVPNAYWGAERIAALVDRAMAWLHAAR